MTLWSRLKTCFRMKFVGAWCCTAWADVSCISAHLKKSLSPRAARLRGEELLHRRLFLHPFVKIVVGQHVEVGFHVVMPQAAKLGADNLVSADFRCRKVQGNIQPGNEVLLYPQFPHKKRVADVFGMHEQMDFLVDGDGHLRGHDV